MPIQQMLLGVGGAAVVQGQQEYTSDGTYSWTAPAGVTSVSAVCIGAGGPGDFSNNATYAGDNYGGGGGACAYKNNITVSPGTSYTVVVGDGQGVFHNSNDGEDSYFNTTSTVKAVGGKCWEQGGNGGASSDCVGDGAYSGGDGSTNSGGGGGQGSGSNGGTGGNSSNYNSGGSAGNGGGGGGADGASSTSTNYTSSGGSGSNNGQFIGAGGGGGSGTAGYGGAGGGGGCLGNNTGTDPTDGGNGASVSALTWYYGGIGSSNCGGGGGGCGAANTWMSSYFSAGSSGSGGVRLIWPGDTRQFPSTNVGDV